MVFPQTFSSSKLFFVALVYYFLSEIWIAIVFSDKVFISLRIKDFAPSKYLIYFDTLLLTKITFYSLPYLDFISF